MTDEEVRIGISIYLEDKVIDSLENNFNVVDGAILEWNFGAIEQPTIEDLEACLAIYNARPI